MQWKRRIIWFFADAVDSQISSGSGDDPLDIRALHGPSKKRRTVVDFQLAVSGRLQTEAIASSSAAYARANRDLNPKTAAGYDEAYLKWYISTGWMTFASPMRFSLTFDASRLGERAEETEVYALWSHCNQRAQYLAPQALFLQLWVSMSLVPGPNSLVIAGGTIAASSVKEALVPKRYMEASPEGLTREEHMPFDT